MRESGHARSSRKNPVSGQFPDRNPENGHRFHFLMCCICLFPMIFQKAPSCRRDDSLYISYRISCAIQTLNGFPSFTQS